MSDSSSSRPTAQASSAIAGVVGGDLLGGRYRIRRVLARGGMATVYQALDEFLDREVAVKIPHLSTDPVFLDRFLREAVAAANLNHENVVSIFDGGQDGDLVYLVMEFVDGASLGDVLRDRGRLSASEAAAVLVPAAAGIGAAHAAGYVHRDVKPENLLLSAEGRVKVTDFGLARAIAATKATFGPGAVVGSAHYLAPEAVRDEPLHAPTDVYALGIVLFESLTGWPPFDAENPFATALRHTRERVPALSDVVDVAQEIDEVVRVATAHEPADRYPDAGAFGAALAGAVPDRTLPEVDRRPASSTIILPRDRADTIVPVPGEPTAGDRQRRPSRIQAPDAARTPSTPTRDVDPADADDGGSARDTGDAPESAEAPEAPEASGASGAEDSAGSTEAGATAGDDEGPTDPTGADAEEDEDRDQDADEGGEEPSAQAVVASETRPRGPRRRRRRRGTRARLVVGVALVGVLAVTAGLLLAWATLIAPVEDIPDVTSQSRDAAVAALEDAGFEAAIDDERTHSMQVPEGDVLAQDPSGTARVGSTVRLELSAGPPPVEGGVPDLAGSSADEALERLREADLESVVERRHDEEVAADTVIAIDPPAGSEILAGEAVTVVVSDGPAPIEVPGVVGSSEQDALAALRDAGLAGTVAQRVFDEEVPAGIVLDQNPGSGEIRHGGDAVELTLSNGPEPFEVPSVIDMGRAAAVDQLRSLGLEVSVSEVDAAGAARPGRVAEQEPSPGSTVRRGDNVRLYVWK